MIAKATEFIRHNPRREIDLLCILTQEQITLQYKRTWLGIVWSLLSPLLLACIFYIAFTNFFLGVLREYIGAIHSQVRRRPLVIEKEKINFGGE